MLGVAKPTHTDHFLHANQKTCSTINQNMISTVIQSKDKYMYDTLSPLDQDNISSDSD